MPSMCRALVSLVKNPVSPQVTKVALVIAYYLVFGCDCMAALFESLYEDDEFDQRQLAALVVSKVFYYLGELNDALSYALGAGALFDVSEDSDYARALLVIGLCLRLKLMQNFPPHFKVRNSTTILTKEYIDALPNGWEEYAWRRINKGILLWIFGLLT
ncbi:hypothetical protein ZWY2020_003665 [Hordeum vulgare]|nr:hypothetical protein ZWY2020_003665 [Hordeum vulgare]